VFSPEAIQRIAFYAKGAPRLINVICDNALLIAYGASQARVSVEIIEEVARDLGLRETRRTLKWAPPTRFQPQPATPIVQQTAAPAKTSAREAPQLFSPRPVIRESIPAAIFPGSQKNVGAVRGAAPTTLPGGNASTTASPETTNGRRAWRSVLTASFVIFLVAVLGFLQLRSSSLWPTIVAVLTHFRSPSPDTRFVPQEPVPSISTTSPSAIVEQDRPSEPRTDPPLEERLEPPQTRISPIAIQSAPFRAQRMSEPSKQEVTK
jgi:hypothetical protein